MKPKRILSRYSASWWLPGATYLVVLIVFAVVALLVRQRFAVLADILLVCLVGALGGLFAAGGWNLIRKRWITAAAHLAILLLCGAATFLAFGFLMLAAMLGPTEDHFADSLEIPEGLLVEDPGEEIEETPGGPEDRFQADIIAALQKEGGDDPSVTADVSSLIRLQQQNPGVLRWYLATSPSWRVFQEGGGTFATRRMMVGSEWQYSLHGYYSQSDIDSWSRAGVPRFQCRVTIGFSGRPWAGASRDSTRMRHGETAPLTLSVGNRMFESHCLIDAPELVAEILEQSTCRERRVTRVALAHLSDEFRPLLEAPDWSTIQRMVPEGSIRTGTPSFELRKSFQPGIYDSEIWINPGEPGMVFLKAHEVTQGTALSVDRLRVYSNEWVGWSDDERQLFLSNTHFTVYEGDWGKPYAARFEVWFAPDSGGPERKLTEKVFRIEGWQR